jgi:peptidoglycan/LPS O-acetylase OafA/YrhL
LETATKLEVKHPGHGWIPALDGVRGLAILMVMLFHYNPELNRNNPLEHLAGSVFGFGWSGVDLFFVLSGFLITGILLDSRPAENYFSSFYARRVLRIFPAYYLSLGLFFLILPRIDPGLLGLLPSAHDRWMYWFYAQNWVGIFRFPGQMLLTPYWSLAVEEQFYLIWPLVVARFAGRKLLAVTAAACGFAVLLRFGCMMAGVHAAAIYANTLTRMDSLLIGAACAIAVRDPRLRQQLGRYARWSWLAPLVPFFGLRLISSRSLPTQTTGLQGIGFTLVAVSYAGLLLTAVLGGNPGVQRFLRSRPLRALGKYSYAAYIWHFPSMYFVKVAIRNRIHPGGPMRILLMVTATMVVSVISYHLVERWFLLLKKKFEPRLPAARDTQSLYEGLPQAAQQSAGR